MSKAFSTALSLGLAGLTVASISASTYAITGDVKLNVNVDPAIALTIQSSSDGSTIYAESDPAGQVVNNYTGEGLTPFGTSSAKTNMLPNTADESMWSKVTVYTNNTEGYKLTVSDTDDNTSLVSGSYIIPTSTSIQAGTAAWAFKGGKFADYTAMSPISSALTIAESTTKSAVDGDTTEIHYGVSTSADQATGTYSDTIVYTVTGEDIPGEPEKITMQNFTCSERYNVGDTFTLVDSRDNKTYTAAKLADGNCWMTQNLALDLDTTITFTPADTDITENWTPLYSTVDEWIARENEPSSTYSDNDEFGNYYNWSAAVATNNSEPYHNQYYEADTSICPKGWTLPSVQQFADLGSAYEVGKSGTNSTAYSVLTSEPINMVIAGGYGLWQNTRFDPSYGSYWTKKPMGSNAAYAMMFKIDEYQSKVALLYSNSTSVRCVAR